MLCARRITAIVAGDRKRPKGSRASLTSLARRASSKHPWPTSTPSLSALQRSSYFARPFPRTRRVWLRRSPHRHLHLSTAARGRLVSLPATAARRYTFLYRPARRLIRLFAPFLFAAANMVPPRRPQLSITLPRNFTFHYSDSQNPRTPEPSETLEPSLPSPPRPERVVRRGPLTIPRCRAAPSFLDEPPVTAADFVAQTSAPQSDMPAAPSHVESVRPLPRPRNLRYITPIRSTGPYATTTPFAQDVLSRRIDWTRKDEGESDGSLSRPHSACSIFSDSSMSSSGSSVSFQSVAGDSCISPECRPEDPFDVPSTPLVSGKGKGRAHSDAIIPTTNDKGAFRSRALSPNHLRASKPRWTEEMDRHLWATYLRYLQDPTVTPFRSDPGRAPPLGVCHRVARAARKSWHGPRSLTGPVEASFSTGHAAVGNGGTANQQRHRTPLRDVYDDTNAVYTNPPASLSMPAAHNPWPGAGPLEAPRALALGWPRSDSATRKRLRQLCRNSATHSSRLQRSLQTRSPMPAAASTPGIPAGRSRLASPFGGFFDQPATSTRHAPTSSTSLTAGQSSGPFAPTPQDNEVNIDSGAPLQMHGDWFGRPMHRWTGDAGGPLGDTGTNAEPSPPPPPPPPPPPAASRTRSTLTGSPYASGQQRNPSTPHARYAMTMSGRLQNHFNSHLSADDSMAMGPNDNNDSSTNVGASSRPLLRSPVNFASTTLPLPSVMRRRAQRYFSNDMSPDSDMRRNILEDLLGSPIFSGGAAARNRRLRSRGFSLGDASAADRLATLFRRPDSDQPMTGTEPAEPGASLGGNDIVTTPQHNPQPMQMGFTEGLRSPFQSVPPRRPQRHRHSDHARHQQQQHHHDLHHGLHHRTESAPMGPQSVGLFYMQDQSPLAEHTIQSN